MDPAALEHHLDTPPAPHMQQSAKPFYQRPSQTSPSHRDPSLLCNPDAVTLHGPSSLPKDPTIYLILLISLLAFPSLLISAAA